MNRQQLDYHDAYGFMKDRSNKQNPMWRQLKLFYNLYARVEKAEITWDKATTKLATEYDKLPDELSNKVAAVHGIISYQLHLIWKDMHDYIGHYYNYGTIMQNLQGMRDEAPIYEYNQAREQFHKNYFAFENFAKDFLIAYSYLQYLKSKNVADYSPAFAELHENMRKFLSRYAGEFGCMVNAKENNRVEIKHVRNSKPLMELESDIFKVENNKPISIE